MIFIDWDRTLKMLDAYLYDEFDGKAPTIIDQLEGFQLKLQDIYNGFQCGEFRKVVKALDPYTDDFEDNGNLKSIRGVKSVEIAHIAALAGFVTGMLEGENYRLHFYDKMPFVED